MAGSFHLCQAFHCRLRCLPAEQSQHSSYCSPPLSNLIHHLPSLQTAFCQSHHQTNHPLSSGFDSLMVVVNHGITKRVILAPCSKMVDAAGITQLFFDFIFKWFGLHDTLISDHGPQFASVFAKELAHLLKYDVHLSTAYHPQTDGQTE